MSTRDEAAQQVQGTVPLRRSRLRGWLAKRGRQFSIAVLILTGLLLVGACGVMLRRATCLIGLPDVGDPFDVAAFSGSRVPVDQDAFALFARAAGKLRPMPNVPMAVRRFGQTVAWSEADPRLREWHAANGEALGLFRQAALQADGMAPGLGDPLRSSLTDLNLGSFVWLAFLDASKSEDVGEMSAAWDEYRAILRTKAHIMRRGTIFDRYFADHFCRGLEPRIATWAADPKTDVPLIRRALDDVRADEPKPEWDAFSLKLEYLRLTSLLDQPGGWAQQLADEEQSIKIGGEPLPPNLSRTVYAARRYLLNEPERSRRVLRLAFANWLAHVPEQDSTRSRPAVRASFLVQNQMTHVSFYTPGPDAPAAARGLSPADLAHRLFTAQDAKALLVQWPWPAVRISERREHRALVVLLAEELYHRDRGSLPAAEEALVGPYLDHLPDDGSGELDDGTAPRIDESTTSGLTRPE